MNKQLLLDATKLGFLASNMKNSDDYILYMIQKWLREIHNIYITISCIPNNKNWYINILTNDNGNGIIMCDNNNSLNINIPIEFITYEEALEAGLQEALKLIS